MMRKGMPVSSKPLDILIVEDDLVMGESLRERLEFEGFRVALFTSGNQALEAAEQHWPPSALLIDIRLPDMSGEAFYDRVLEILPPAPSMFFMTGYGSVEQAVRLVKRGATDYLTKPVDVGELVGRLHEICGQQSVAEKRPERLGVSPSMRRIEELLERVAGHAETPVLITGESGSGKEEVARYLHELENPNEPFVPVNCTAISQELVESELFGHERGAFTGATRRHHGVFERARHGTILLDEIGDMPLLVQAKLLRAIQEKQITRVGGEEPIHVGPRLLCATHANLAELVQNSQFREDLYYRINVLEIALPPLRDRPEDIDWLADHFLAGHQRRYPGDAKVLSNSARAALHEYLWPGNVRELGNVLERACILCHQSVIGPGDLFGGWEEAGAASSESTQSLQARVEEAERAHIIAILHQNDWRIGESARSLGITRKTLWKRMRRLGIRKSLAGDNDSEDDAVGVGADARPR